MATKMKEKTYGKNKSKEIVAAFASINITPSPTKPTNLKIRQQRQVLGPIKQNEVTRDVNRSNNTMKSQCTTIKKDAPVAGSIECSSPPEPLSPERVTQQPRARRGRKPKNKDHINHEPIRITSTRKLSDRAIPTSKSTLSTLPLELSTLLSLPYVHPTIQNFTQQYKFWTKTLTPKKIAQGSFASIFRLALTSHPEVYTIWKLMPLKPRTGKGSRQVGATSVNDALAELKLLEGMSNSPGFVEFRSARVLRGELPEDLGKVHQAWVRGLAEKDRGDLGDALDFDSEQLWLFLEMTDAGTDLETLLEKGFPDGMRLGREHIGKIDILEASDIFWGIAEALAHGEEHAEFEHRDLHAGNVCVKRRPRNLNNSVNEEPQCLIRRFTDLEVTLIDYTLSRATIHYGGDEQGEEAKAEILANSMRDKSLFEQSSEIEIDQMQYDTYRRMRDIMHSRHKGRRKIDGWESHMPMINILWLHHILKVLLRYTGIFSTEWKIIELSREKREAMTAVHLDDVRRKTDPENIKTWQNHSASELVSGEIMKAQEKTLCEVLENISISPSS